MVRPRITYQKSLYSRRLVRLIKKMIEHFLHSYEDIRKKLILDAFELPSPIFCCSREVEGVEIFIMLFLRSYQTISVNFV